MERSGLYWVPDNVRRARRIMGVEGIPEYYCPLRRLVMAEYPKFEDFEGLRIIGELSRPPVLLLLKGTVRVRQGLKVGTQDQCLLQISRWLGIQAGMCRSRKHAVRVGRSGVVVRLVG